MSLSLKPLYIAEKKIQYQRHRMRLQTIGGEERPKKHYNQKHNNFIKIRQRTSEHKIMQNLERLNQQNQKLLNKLLQISNKKGASFSFSNHIEKKIQKFNSPFRKKIATQIEEENILLGSRLLNRKSQFEDLNLAKNIKQYIKLRNSMQKNKRIQLDPLNGINQKIYNKKSASYSRVTQKSLISMNNVQNDEQRKVKAKVNTQPNTIAIEHSKLT